jgi:hypothetical protein
LARWTRIRPSRRTTKGNSPYSSSPKATASAGTESADVGETLAPTKSGKTWKIRKPNMPSTATTTPTPPMRMRRPIQRSAANVIGLTVKRDSGAGAGFSSVVAIGLRSGVRVSGKGKGGEDPAREDPRPHRRA